MTLNNQLQAIADQFEASAQTEVYAKIEAGIEITRSSLSPLEVGAQAPDFTLPNAAGAPVALSDLLQSGPVVLSFYRGGWCPFCNLELRALQAKLDQFADFGASLVAVSPEIPDATLSTREKNELEFPVLSDHGSQVGRSYGLSFTLDADTQDVYEGFGLDLPTLNGAGTWDIVVPGTYVIDSDGTIAASFVDPDYRRRTDPTDVLAVVAELAAVSA